MSNPYLPQEILDEIIDLLHDHRDALKRCCLVSESWVPRTRQHLFAKIEFKPENYDKWKKTFTDPMNSPAHHTQTLTVEGFLLSAVDDSWIQGFSCVEELIVGVIRQAPKSLHSPSPRSMGWHPPSRPYTSVLCTSRTSRPLISLVRFPSSKTWG